MTEIRLATPADAPELARLRYAFRASIGDAVEDEAAFIQRCTEWMKPRLQEHSPWRCWVAEHDGAIVGHLWLCMVEKIPNPVPENEWHAYITNVYVDPAHRGGPGTALMETAMNFAKKHGADSAILWPTEGSRSLYSRFGFDQSVSVMETQLAARPDFSP